MITQQSAQATRLYAPQDVRPYQREAVDAIKAALAPTSDKRRPLIWMATGTGKTTVIAVWFTEQVDPKQHRALVLGHTEEIVGQLKERIENQYGGAASGYITAKGWMYPGIGIVMAEKDDANARIICATRQSLSEDRVRRILEHGPIDYLVIDEAHHAAVGTTYDAIVKQLREANPDLALFGVTATPNRSDQKSLTTVFTHIPFSYTIQDAQRDGYLVPIHRFNVATKVDVTKIRNTAKGDYSSSKLESVLRANNWLDLCGQAYEEHIIGTGRSTLAFFPSVGMSEAFTETMRRKGQRIVHIDGTTPKAARRETLRAFNAGQIDAISNVAVFTEGVDSPRVSAIFLARPTRSESLFAQIIGRGLRLHPDKEDCLLVDLSVRDTRAVDLAKLTGRMLKCEFCDTSYMYGLSKCPNCGRVPTAGAGGGEGAPDEEFEGEGLITHTGRVFRDAFSAWYGQNGYYSISGGDDGMFVIVPPIHDERYYLLHLAADWTVGARLLGFNDDLASLILVADDVVRKYAKDLANKNASWRSRKASAGQLNALKRMGVAIRPDLTSGQASQLITHRTVMRRLSHIDLKALIEAHTPA